MMIIVIVIVNIIVINILLVLIIIVYCMFSWGGSLGPGVLRR